MRIFLMRMLRHKSDISISKIKSEIAVLEKRIKEWDELSNKLSRIKSVTSELSKDKDKILYFFNSVENSED